MKGDRMVFLPKRLTYRLRHSNRTIGLPEIDVKYFASQSRLSETDAGL